MSYEKMANTTEIIKKPIEKVKDFFKPIISTIFPEQNCIAIGTRIGVFFVVICSIFMTGVVWHKQTKHINRFYVSLSPIKNRDTQEGSPTYLQWENIPNFVNHNHNGCILLTHSHVYIINLVVQMAFPENTPDSIVTIRIVDSKNNTIQSTKETIFSTSLIRFTALHINAVYEASSETYVCVMMNMAYYISELKNSSCFTLYSI